MTDSMVERVAKALAGSYGRNPLEIVLLEPRLVAWGQYTVMARAAIEAMREPTEGMCDASFQARDEGKCQYKAMIDAALSPKDENLEIGSGIK